MQLTTCDCDACQIGRKIEQAIETKEFERLLDLIDERYERWAASVTELEWVSRRQFFETKTPVEGDDGELV
jgi:hypothetical protein